jgi:hypothetical protein
MHLLKFMTDGNAINCDFALYPHHLSHFSAGQSLTFPTSVFSLHSSISQFAPLIMAAYIPSDPSRSQNSVHDDYKASYDDLIDEYSSPYVANSRHQTFTITSPDSDGHRRDPSVPFGSKNMSSKQSDDMSHEPLSHAYPPLPPTKDADSQSLWQKVRCRRSRGFPHSSRVHP